MTDLEYAVLTEWFDHLVSSENIRVDLFGKYFWPVLSAVVGVN